MKIMILLLILLLLLQSFLIFGSLPLVPIMVALLLPDSDSQQSFNGAVGFSILFTVLTLAALGSTKVLLLLLLLLLSVVVN